MSGPLVHIGFHKTASSWFQQRLYPGVRNGCFIPRKIVRASLIEPRAFAFSSERAREQLLAHSQGARPLICEENLSGYLHNGGLGGLLSMEMARRIHSVFPDAQIVAFIRSQRTVLEASYAQYVHAGGTYGIRRYLGLKKSRGIPRYWYKAPRFALEHFEYQHLLAHYADLFGRSAVHVYCYEDFLADPPAFVGRYVAEHGLEIDSSELSYAPVNQSLSPRRLRILALLNLLTERSVPNKRTLFDAEDWYDRRWRWLDKIDRYVGRWWSDEPILTDEERIRLAASYADDNRRLEEMWQLHLKKHDYSLPAPIVDASDE